MPIPRALDVRASPVESCDFSIDCSFDPDITLELGLLKEQKKLVG